MYLKEQLPWFILFIVLNISILIIGLIDPSIPNISLLYLVIVNGVVFTGFTIWDYFRKRDFYKDIKSLNEPDDIDALHVAKTPLQQEINESLERVRRTHTVLLESEATKTRENLNELTRFVHDMKMPLTTMNLMIQDLEDDKKTRLSSEMNRLEGMLNEILYVKRLPNIKNDLYIESVNLNDLFNRSIQKVRYICMKKGLGFDLDLEINEVDSDVKWLQFIIDQLITNSVKYSEDSTIYITASKQQGYDTLSIKDFGRGIKSEDLPRVFESGFTSTSNHDDGHSTGMGLYLTKNVSEILNIYLAIDSTYGKGTTVTLWFSKQNEFNQISSM